MIAKMIVILLMTLSLGMNIADHGKERKPTNGWHALIGYSMLFGGWLTRVTKGLFL